MGFITFTHMLPAPDLITRVLFSPLHDAGAVRYRQEVFRDLDDPALFDAVRDFVGRMSEVGAHLRQLADMRYRHQREGWLDEHGPPPVALYAVVPMAVPEPELDRDP